MFDGVENEITVWPSITSISAPPGFYLLYDAFRAMLCAHTRRKIYSVYKIIFVLGLTSKENDGRLIFFFKQPPCCNAVLQEVETLGGAEEGGVDRAQAVLAGRTHGVTTDT